MRRLMDFINGLINGDLSKDRMKGEMRKRIIKGYSSKDFGIALQYRLVKELAVMNKNIEELIDVVGSVSLANQFTGKK